MDLPSFITQHELSQSVEIIEKTILNTELKLSYLYLYNFNKNYNFAVVKIWLDKNNQNIEYFL